MIKDFIMSELTGFLVSPQQASWWRTLEPSAISENVNRIELKLHSAMSVQVLNTRLHAVAEVEEILRTRLQILPGMAQPIQSIDDSVDLQVQEHDWRALNLDQQYLAKQQVFQAASYATLQVFLLHTQQHSLLVLQAGSGYLDIQSLHMVAAQLIEGFSDEERLQYVDYAQWKHDLLNEDITHPGIVYWQEAKAQSSVQPLAGLCVAKPQGFTLGSVQLPALDFSQLQQSAAQLNVSVQDFLFSAWAILLARLTGDSQLQLALLFDSRTQGLENALGAYEQPLPVTVNLDLNATLSEQSQVLLKNVALACGWSDYYDCSANNGFYFSYRTVHNSALQTYSQLQSMHYPFSIGLECIEQQETSGNVSYLLQINYNTKHLSQQSITHIVEQWSQVLEGLTDKHQTIGDIELFGERQAQCIVSAQSAALVQPCSIIELIKKHSVTRPNAIALIDHQGELSYGQLERQSSVIAQQLLGQGLVASDVVAVLLPRSQAAIVAMLATLKAGLTYLPLDPAYPAERIHYMLKDSGAKYLFSTEQLSSELGSEVALLDVQSLLSKTLSAQALPAHDPQATAYLIYTSGSTGQPKAVAISYASLSHSTQVRMQYYAQKVKTYLLLSSLSFDSSVAGIYWTLAQGGSLVLPQNGEELDLAVLSQLILKHQVSHSLSLPSLYESLLDFAGKGALDSLQAWIVAGEACNFQVIEKNSEKLPGCSLYNEYGPTEATVWASVAQLYTPETGGLDISIGVPIPGAEFYLLNEQGNLSGIGEAGQIYIAGPTLAKGYFGQPEYSNNVFVSLAHVAQGKRLYRTGDLARWRYDATLDFLGRQDQQIKIRGYRIELAEIERELREHSDVREAAIVVNTQGVSKQLVGYITDRHGYAPDTQALVNFLAARLPEYMIPAIFIHLKSMPHTPNGKIDLNALPAPSAENTSQAVYLAPRNAMEAALVDICAQVLKQDKVGVNDSFFQIGGDSILSLQIVTRANQQGIKISAKQVFECETIAKMALVATHLSAEQMRESEEQARVNTSTENSQNNAFSLVDFEGDDFDNLVAELDALE
jgi:amino acid adenylation domain-containing protein